ncbi:type IX secretion system periplasmic lipoprotein PorW/SprE [Ekhidna lutea]|uniref:type IX secretion system periplasmic lipoprotein PorW/SprE n=1 Tax=Ekhidna lutea TaxID=447679 RepID=UPI00117D624E|nr:methyltransferase [Ekhidna lutea]
MKKIILLIIIAAFIGCSPYKNNPLSSSFHDLTAHYNAYFIANERINEIEQSIFESQDWNYNKVLPIYAQFDSVKSASLSTQIEDCIQKASIAIQRHPNSKWEDDSYILVGKARHYAMEFPDAIETFKYVNTHSKDDNARHQALTLLIRTFTEFNEFNNAIAVTDYLAKEKLNKENQRRLHLNSAYLYQKKDDKSKMVGSLVKAEELLNSSDKARINFIIGQVFHELEFESEAFRYYKNVLKNNPTYELEFYAKLYMSQVTELADGGDLKKIQRYFKSLLRDPKNKEYRDKIYYELAGFELKNGNLEEAIDNYKLSIRNSVNNNRQKAYSYLSLGQIYYDTLKDYVLAKDYYDSTVNTMPRDEDNYAEIKERQEILVDFVEQIVTIQKNDSLLHLASLPQDSVLVMFTAQVESTRKANEERKKKEKQAAINRARSITQSAGDNLITTASTGATWYFNNTSALSKGRSDFIRKWGERALEDDWRRNNKTASNISEEETVVANREISESSGEEETVESAADEARRMMESLPTSEQQQATLLGEIEVALYNLGNIYNLRLEEDANAAESFEKLLSRFPVTEYEAEVLYQLYLLYKNLNPQKSKQKGELLKQKYPETIYAKLVDNPNYREESFAISAQLKGLYKRLYQKYKAGSYKEILFASDSALSLHPENEFSDNVALLKVLAIGQTEEDHKYQFELGEFINEYPESELNEYAKSLLTASENFQQKRYNSARARFIEDFNQKHLFVIAYDIKSDMTDKLPPIVDEYLKEKNLTTLKTGNLILSDQKSMLLVNIFPGKGTAISFMKSINQELNLKETFKGQKFDVFVITEDNFDIFYQTKDVSAYLSFFEKHY